MHTANRPSPPHPSEFETRANWASRTGRVWHLPWGALAATDSLVASAQDSLAAADDAVDGDERHDRLVETEEFCRAARAVIVGRSL